jgi:stress-induced morphogen
MLAPETLKQLVLEQFPDAALELKDLTGTRDHYQLEVISQAFEGMPQLKRHRLVYSALGGHMGGDIHALALNTYTPAERARP